MKIENHWMLLVGCFHILMEAILNLLDLTGFDILYLRSTVSFFLLSVFEKMNEFEIQNKTDIR